MMAGQTTAYTISIWHFTFAKHSFNIRSSCSIGTHVQFFSAMKDRGSEITGTKFLEKKRKKNRKINKTAESYNVRCR